MTYPRVILALGVVLALAGCASKPAVTSDTVPGANIASYRTFAFLNPPLPALPPTGLDPVANERIRQGVSNALVAKGYSPGMPGDLTIIVTIGARERANISSWGPYWARLDVRQYTEGKLAVDVFDSKTLQPLWHGQATQTIDPNTIDPEVVNNAVGSVMAGFPGGGGRV